MKGFPLREFFIMLLGAGLFVIPLRFLTRPAQPAHVHSQAAPMDPAAPSEVEAWVEFRFSHAPEEIKIFQNGVLLFEGGGGLREDADIALQLSEARNALELEFRWSEAVEQAYVELKLEVEGLPVRRLGFWGKGEEKRSWILAWEEGL